MSKFFKDALSNFFDGIDTDVDEKNKQSEHHTIKTAITLDYRKNSWGLERIVLDTISNHLPSDSKGTKVWVEYLQDNFWTYFTDYNPERKVSAIRVRDNGVGFDYKLLELLYSTKHHSVTSVGQFGEGIKLGAAACIRNNLDVTYHARDWTAKAFSFTELIDGKNIDRLCFEIYFKKESIEGSQTQFNNPPTELVEEFNRLPSKALYFNPERKKLFSFKKNDCEWSILEPHENNSIFVKGIHLKSGRPVIGTKLVWGSKDSEYTFHPMIFSYDLNTENISPDRKNLDITTIRQSILALILKCDNISVLRTILSIAEKNDLAEYEEFSALRYFSIPDSQILSFNSSEYNSAKNRWKNAFHEEFGADAVLAARDKHIDEYAEAYGMRLVYLNHNVETFLKCACVETSNSLLTGEFSYQFVNQKEFSEQERKNYLLINKVNKKFGYSKPPIQIGIYESRHLIKRDENGNVIKKIPIHGATGVYVKHEANPENDFIAILRSQLSDPKKLLSTYIHEIGHMSGNLNHDQKFSDFFVDKIADMILDE